MTASVWGFFLCMQKAQHKVSSIRIRKKGTFTVAWVFVDKLKIYRGKYNIIGTVPRFDTGWFQTDVEKRICPLC